MQGDGLKQERGLYEAVEGKEQPVEGSARIFILPNTSDRKLALAQVREWCAKADSDEGWVTPELAVKILVIVHRIAAKRLGWEDIFSALSDRSPDSIKQGLLDGTCWPVQPFLGFVLPLVAAMQDGNEFEAMNILRARCPRLATSNLVGKNAVQLLHEVRKAKLELVRMMDGTTSCSIRDVAAHLRDTGLLALDERLERALRLQGGVADAEGGEAAEGQSSDLPVLRFLECPATQLIPYGQYVSEGSPFATQHGVKGAQFDRVLVVMDEEENDFRLYDYEKVLGDAQLVLKTGRLLRRARTTHGAGHYGCFMYVAPAPNVGWHSFSLLPTPTQLLLISQQAGYFLKVGFSREIILWETDGKLDKTGQL